LQRFADNVMKVTGFCTVTIVVGSLVVFGFYCPPEQVSGFFNLVAYSRQVHQPERGAIFLD
jgi:hypothetical protein